jgi:hypothetical protein
MTHITVDDMGTSSTTILLATTGIRYSKASIPLDPADFHRCYLLLEALCKVNNDEYTDFTHTDFLFDVKRMYPEWTKLVKNWNELVLLYKEEIDSGACPKLYARMQELR